MSTHLEEITVMMPKGTRSLLKEIKEKCGLTTEDVLRLGFRYLEAKQNHEAKKAEARAAEQSTESINPTPSSIITPDRF